MYYHIYEKGILKGHIRELLTNNALKTPNFENELNFSPLKSVTHFVFALKKHPACSAKCFLFFYYFK